MSHSIQHLLTWQGSNSHLLLPILAVPGDLAAKVVRLGRSETEHDGLIDFDFIGSTEVARIVRRLAVHHIQVVVLVVRPVKPATGGGENKRADEYAASHTVLHDTILHHTQYCIGQYCTASHTVLYNALELHIQYRVLGDIRTPSSHAVSSVSWVRYTQHQHHHATLGPCHVRHSRIKAVLYVT